MARENLEKQRAMSEEERKQLISLVTQLEQKLVEQTQSTEEEKWNLMCLIGEHLAYRPSNCMTYGTQRFSTAFMKVPLTCHQTVEPENRQLYHHLCHHLSKSIALKLQRARTH